MSDFASGNISDKFTTPEEEALLAAAGETPLPGAAYVDPDLAALAGDAPDTAETPLDDLAAELAEDLDVSVTLPVEIRPRWKVKFRTDFKSREVEKIRKQCHDKAFSDKIDGAKFAALLIATTCVAIYRDGNPVPLESGREATFMEPEFLDMFKRPADGPAPLKAVEAITRFYGGDGRIDAIAKQLMEEAGYGSEVVAVDPT